MKRADKESFVQEFQARIQNTPVFYLTDFTGLDVKSITRLRHRLQEAGADYLVVKNRLVLRALDAADRELPDLSEHLTGPTGVILAPEGPVDSAKAVTEFAKEHGDRPVFKVGVLDSSIVEVEQFQKLARLPTREQLLAELAGAMQAPMAALAGALEGKLQEMAGLFDALREQKAAE
jgi:large subunit ribosomal protein L10